MTILDFARAGSPLPGLAETTIRILYVDDEPDLLEIGKHFLERAGTFSVTVCSSAEEGFRALECQSFDAIVSDYQMPEMDGITFLKELRHRGDRTPFILFTGRGREEVVIEAYEQGVDHYVQKGGGPRAQFIDLAHKIRCSVEKYRIEERNKSLTRRLEFISCVNQILTQNRHPDEMLADICSLIIQYRTFELAGAGFIDAEENLVIPTIVRSRTTPHEIPSISLSASNDPCGEALTRGFPYVCNDLDHLQKSPRWKIWAEKNSFHAICSVPLWLFGDLVGAFVIFSKQGGAFDSDLIVMLAEMGGAISFALSTLEGDAHRHGRVLGLFPPEKKDSQSLMEAITGIHINQALGSPFKSILALLCDNNTAKLDDRISPEYPEPAEDLPVIIYSVDSHGIITSISAVVEQFSSSTAQDLIGRDISELVCPTDRYALKTTIAAALDGEESPCQIMRIRDQEGNVHDFVESHHLMVRAGRDNGLIGVLQKIPSSYARIRTEPSDEIRAEQIRQSLFTQITTLYGCVNLLVEENPGSDPYGQYQEKIHSIARSIRDMLIEITENPGKHR